MIRTTFLSDELYPKVPNTLSGLVDYADLTALLLKAKIRKDKRVFDNSKVTDHHAIIPTGVPARNLTDNERKVYDLVARRFIAAFYPDCEISTTTVLGKVGKVDFKVTGKQILKPGWRVVFGAEQKDPDAEPSDEEGVLPDFVKGESGPHKPTLGEKWTQPPKPYTEATLLRAMETAGKLVDNDELRDALKENGIGRPSTRAAIIETLFKRNYIRKERKNLFPTATGVELIGTIQEELLKSAELSGLWEKKLRQIERGTYEARTFLEELKQMVHQVVINVLSDQTGRTITIEQAARKSPKPKKSRKKRNRASRVPKRKRQPVNRKKKTFPQSRYARSARKAASCVVKQLTAVPNIRVVVLSAWTMPLMGKDYRTRSWSRLLANSKSIFICHRSDLLLVPPQSFCHPRPLSILPLLHRFMKMSKIRRIGKERIFF